MKNKRIKLFLWFFIAMLIEVCISHSLKIMGARPMIVYILIISVAMLEEDFVSSAVMPHWVLRCSVLSWCFIRFRQ